MKPTKRLAPVILSIALAGPTAALAAPVPALAPQAVPPAAMQAIDAVNQAAENNAEVPLFDSRVLSIGLGTLAGVLVYNLLPGSAMVGRAVPGAVGRAVGRMGTTVVVRSVTTSQFPMMTSAVVGGLVGDYMYRKNNRVPSVSSAVAGRITP
ncbi:conserved exported hypothetical protein [Gammaproteobacteria bacterium]